jgi:3-hydroxy-9,10-secoandrosta-1,3,5(10)-triene-9,17-dione monooxygenase
MPAVSVDVPSADTLVRRARDMIPAIAAHAAEGRAARCLAPGIVAAMREAGLFRALQPRRWGGYELSPDAYFDIQLALSEGDMSAGWIYGIVGVHPAQLALFDDRAQEGVWGKDATALICSSLIPAGQARAEGDGFRISGRWKYASGCDHADWALLGAVVTAEDGAPIEGRLFLVPMAEIEIDHESWRVSGLQATGSKDLVVAESFVPDWRTQRFADNFACEGPGRAVNTGALYRMPVGQLFFRGASTASLGALQAMLDAIIAYARERRTATGSRTAEDPMVQLACAEAASAIDEMTTILHRNFANLARYAARDEVPPLDERVKYKFQSAQATERCCAHAARLFKASGAGGLADDKPFSRLLADINAARQHYANQADTHGRNWGATLFGFPGAGDVML